MKKTIVFLLCLVFILSTTASAIKISTEQEKIDDNSENNKEENNYEKITLYRYGLDNSITPVEIELEKNSYETIEETIKKKCEELFKQDSKFQDFIKNLPEIKLKSKFTGDWGWLYVSSHGIGKHYKTKMLLRVVLKLSLFRFKLPQLSIKLRREIFCKYEHDLGAETNIVPIIRTAMGYNAAKNMTGNHSVYVHSFAGFTTWSGRFSISPEKKIPRAFAGVGRLVICKQFP